jgi:hypothetical protein
MSQLETAREVRKTFLTWLGLNLKSTWKYKNRNGIAYYECTLAIHKRQVVLSVEKEKMNHIEQFVEEMKQQLRDSGYPGLVLPRRYFEQKLQSDQ